MEIGVNQAAASMAAIERWNDSVADNIASTSSPGFKARSTGFSIKTEAGAGAAPSRQVRPTGMPTASSTINLAQGELRPTGQPLDLAVSGEGFFAIQLPTGQTVYTRDGEFRLSPDNRVVTKTGGELLGEGMAPIFLDPALGEIAISGDGRILQGGQEMGRIPLYSVPKDDLKSIGGAVFLASDDAKPVEVDDPSIQQGFLEMGNASMVGEMISMIAASRAYEAAQKVLTNHDEARGRAIQTFSNS